MRRTASWILNAGFGLFNLTTSVWCLCMHVWGILIAYKQAGLLVAAVTGFIPISGLFWAGYEWWNRGFFNTYTVSVAIAILAMVFIILLAKAFQDYDDSGAAAAEGEPDRHEGLEKTLEKLRAPSKQKEPME